MYLRTNCRKPWKTIPRTKTSRTVSNHCSSLSHETQGRLGHRGLRWARPTQQAIITLNLHTLRPVKTSSSIGGNPATWGDALPRGHRAPPPRHLPCTPTCVKAEQQVTRASAWTTILLSDAESARDHELPDGWTIYLWPKDCRPWTMRSAHAETMESNEGKEKCNPY